MKKLFVVLIVLAFSASFISCKKDDVIQNEKGLVKQQKNGGEIDEALLHFILSQINFDAYVAGEEVEKERTIINGNCTYGVFIADNQSELDEWIATEIANGKETGSLVVQGLFVGISKMCDSYPFILPIDNEPYEYAVYEEDFDFLSEYILSGGYFMFSNDENGLIKYVCLTEAEKNDLLGTEFPFNIFDVIGFDFASYNGEDIHIEEDSVVVVDGGGKMECCRIIITRDAVKFWIWVNHEVAAKRDVSTGQIGKLYVAKSKKLKG